MRRELNSWIHVFRSGFERSAGLGNYYTFVKSKNCAPDYMLIEEILLSAVNHRHHC